MHPQLDWAGHEFHPQFTVPEIVAHRESRTCLDCVQPPPNDNCASATPVSEGVYTGTTNGASNDGAASCGLAWGPDVWYSYTAPCDGVLVISAEGSGFPVISLHDGCTCSTSNCCIPHGGPGCTDPVCAEFVCAVAPWCCFGVPEFGWDSDCVWLASLLCGGEQVNCAQGMVSTAVVEGTSYLIRVAWQFGETGPFSLSINLDPEAIPAPTNVSATDGTQCDVFITWSDVSAAEVYDVYRSVDNPPCPGTPIGTTQQNSYIDTLALPGQVYFYAVRARNACTSSDCSNANSGFGTAEPGVPENVSASDDAHCDRVHVTWDPAPSATAYRVYRSDSGDACQALLDQTTATHFDDYTAAPGQTYYYSIKATNDCYIGNCSEVDAGRAYCAGACCFGDGFCTLVDQESCSSTNGAYLGDGTSCTPNPCPQPACCLPDGWCEELSLDDCSSAGGVSQGAGTSCNAVNCPDPDGACCSTVGVCITDTESNCVASGGTYQGDGTLCDPNPCFQIGACCLGQTCAADTSETDCTAAAGIFLGPGSTCTPGVCTPGTGACCSDAGMCIVLPEGQCVGTGGTYQGDDTECEPSPCPQIGACCHGQSCSADTPLSICEASGGVFLGAGSICEQGVCEGACCIGQACAADTTSPDCDAAGGLFLGPGSTCAPGVCDPTTGACCSDVGFCLIFTEAECLALGATYHGDDTMCEPNPCLQIGACCIGQSCAADTTLPDCDATAGVFLGPGSICEPGACSPPSGACCSDTGLCIILTEADCVTFGATYQGDDTTCSPDPCSASCPEDLSGNGQVDFADILAIVAAWGPCGGSCPEDLSGNNQVDFADVLVVIAAWGACP
jgi:hypothetical protein